MIDVVCGVIEDVEGRYLACLRPVGKHLGGLWEFPGGKVDSGETPEAALIRELREELEVDVEVGLPLTPVTWNYDERVIRLLPYRCRIIGGELSAVEHELLRWCYPQHFGDLLWAAADVPILQEITTQSERNGKLTS
ncbi:MAG: (deoxy)nucleoside triphosphate pyrophosphohydrolase [Luteolibacter sp.]|uniref:(deoxy)nucleoside triphosphate pyrophosphohydrolase n=1 Tax=Luteolibacter sp. TaxID=1962973 RepID=UPI003266E668